MAATVNLKDIVEALEMASDEFSSFLDPDVGEVESVSCELLRKVDECADGEEPGDLPAWQKQEWELAVQIVSSGRFLKLPTKFDVHEWAIMRDYAGSVSSREIRENLTSALHGSGAFRHFKSALRRHHIEDSWFAFRDNALREIAIDWCAENDIPWK